MSKSKYFITFLLINWFSINLITSQVDTIMVFSESMNKNVPNIVITPDDYSNQNEKLPVLYLLHGAGGDYAGWASYVPEVKAYADKFNMIIVCPDGGSTSWYFDSPIDSKMKYETYVSKELVSAIDKKYPTIPENKGRAITGLSMGGHGALYLAFKHQDVWGAAGSMSGGVDIRPFPNGWDISQRLGTYAENKQNWEDNTVMNMVHLLNGNLEIIIDCGYDDFFFEVTRRLHEKLVLRNIPHDYIERPGGHNYEYWANSLKYQLVFFEDFFKENTP